jgi:UDP-glucose 4-epimerase
MPQNILVTGGAGFIGSHLVDVLAEAGHRVTALDDLTRGRRTWLHPGVDLHQVDVRDAAAVQTTMQRVAPDIVVHLAAIHFIPMVDGAPELAKAVNVTGTRNVVEALAKQPPRLLLFASTAAVYPDCRGPISEDCEPAPLDLYGRTKLEGEALVADFASRSGVSCTIARIFNVIGRRETNPHVVPELVGQLRAGATSVRLGNLEPRRDYTDVRDVADALGRLLVGTHEGLRVINVGSGISASVRELVQLCEEVLGRSISVHLDAERARAHDRAELVADSRLLYATTGWQTAITLRETLEDLLTNADEES